MIDGLKPYPKRKDSGVPWLGQVPEHWDVRRLRNVAEMRVSNVDKHSADDEEPVRLCNYVDVYKNDRIRGSMPFMQATAMPAELERFRLQIGDVLITKDSESWDDIGVPALVEESADDLICGYHLALLRPRVDQICGAYLFRALQSNNVSFQFHVLANGVTRYGLPHGAIKSIWLPMPPLSEQEAVVRFIDHRDRRIRRYVRGKQKLIKLLEEQKQAIIHRAVTRGLDPNVRLKPSGIDWLGDIPEHWEVRKLGQIAQVFNGMTPSRMQPKFWIGGKIPWLSSGKVNDYIVETSSEFVTEKAVRECPIEIVPQGSVIVGLVGQGKTRGMSAMLRIDTCINQNLAAVVPSLVLDGTFLLHVLTAHYKAIREIGRGGNQAALNCDLVANLRIPLPSIDEQALINEHIAVTASHLERAGCIARDAVHLIREYQIQLIADVVTGKLDVREAAARLPIEIEEPESFDDEDFLVENEEEVVSGDLDDALEEVEA